MMSQRLDFNVRLSFADAFRGKTRFLVDNLDVSHGLLDELYDLDVLTRQHVADIKSCRTEYERAAKLLTILASLDGCLFPAFCSALEATGQHLIVDMLKRGQVLPSLFGADDLTYPGLVHLPPAPHGSIGPQQTSSIQVVSTENMTEQLMGRVPTSAAAAAPTGSGGLLQGISHARPGEIESGAVRTMKYSDLQQPQAITQGGFGVLYRARHDRWGDVAYKELLVKVINDDDRIGRGLRREAQMFKLNHPNIVKLLGLVFEPEHYGLIFEFAQFGGLDNFLTKYDIGFSLKMSFAIEIVEAMTYLHSFQPPVIHGDLKLQNVLVSIGYIAKICDFGLAKWKTFTTQQTSSTSGRAGSMTHFPPETWNNLLLSRTAKFDVYTFGILLWELLSEEVPYQEARGNMDVIRLAVTSGERPSLEELKCPEIFSVFVKGVIGRCWNQQPEGRPTFSDLRHELQQFIDEHELIVDKRQPLELREYDNW